MATATKSTKSTKSTADVSTIEGVFTALLSGGITAHDAAIAASAFNSATVKRTASDTARNAWVIGLSADAQYVSDNGKPEADGKAESVKKVAEHAVKSFGRSFEVTTVRNAVSFSRALQSLNILTMASFDAAFGLFAERCADKSGKAYKSDPKLYKVHASQFMTYIGRLNQPGRVSDDGVVHAVDNGVVQRTTQATARNRADADAAQQRAERLETLTTDGYKIGRVSVSSVVMLSEAERKDLALLLDHLNSTK